MRRLFALLVFLAWASVTQAEVQAFYYPWYGTPEFDGEFIHWRHSTMGQGPHHEFPGGLDIGADFYPESGCYSSREGATIERHMQAVRLVSMPTLTIIRIEVPPK